MLLGQELLQDLRRRPTTYLDEPSLRLLVAFDHGYGMACEHAAARDVLFVGDSGFYEWVTERLALPRSSHNWWGQMLLIWSGQEAFDQAFRFLDEYRLSHSPESEANLLPVRLPTGNWRELFDAMRRRPAMYLGSPAVSLMRAFWDGYSHAARIHNPADDPGPDFDRFAMWLQAKHGFRQPFRWEKIQLFWNGSEATALESFFIDFDNFRSAPPDGTGHTH